MKTAVIRSAVLALIVSGCATYYEPIPEGYSGPTAKISDDYLVDDLTHCRLFYVAEIDGREVLNNLIGTRITNRGKPGFSPVIYSRNVPAKKITLKLVAKVEYAAPIYEIVSSNKPLLAEQTIELDAKPNASYLVHGVLSSGNSSVWLIDQATGERVGTPLTPK